MKILSILIDKSESWFETIEILMNASTMKALGLAAYNLTNEEVISHAEMQKEIVTHFISLPLSENYSDEYSW